MPSEKKTIVLRPGIGLEAVHHGQEAVGGGEALLVALQGVEGPDHVDLRLRRHLLRGDDAGGGLELPSPPACIAVQGVGRAVGRLLPAARASSRSEAKAVLACAAACFKPARTSSRSS